MPSLAAADSSFAQPVSQTTGGVRWQAHPDWADVLLTSEGLPLAAWQRGGVAQVVKQGEHRTVHRVDLPAGALYVKHYHSPRQRWDLRTLFRPTAARREWNKAVEIGRRGVPTVTPIALGEQCRSGTASGSFLVTSAIDDALTLDAYVATIAAEPVGFVRVRCLHALIVAVAKLCATAHRAGVDHNDFHAGNILVQRAVADRREPLALYLIDVPGVRLSGPLNWRRSRASLVMIYAAWRDQLAARHRRMFLRHYLAERGDLSVDPLSAENQILAQTGEYARQVMRSRDRRAALSNRDFLRIATDDGVAHAVRDVSVADIAAVLAGPELLIQRNLHRPVKLSHSSVVVEATLSLNGVATPVAFKRCRRKTWSKRLVGLIESSRAWRSWHFGHALRARGIATPRPVLVCRPRGLVPRDSYLATEWVAGALDLHRYGWELARREPLERGRRVRQTAIALGRLIGKLHAWRISHRDLKALNVLIVERAAEVECLLIDLDGIQFRRKLSDARRASDLARLAASLVIHPWVPRTARARFLLNYAAELPDEHGDLRQLSARISRQVEKTVRRQQRRGESPA